MKRILVIDDDIPIGDLLEELLTKAGYGVLRAYSGTEALLVFAAERPDLVLLDLMLPGLRGEDVLLHMQGVPVIIMSARADVDSKADLLLSGAADYITKPFQQKELLARIAVQLRQTAACAQGAVLRFQEIALDTGTHIATVGTREIKLTRTEFAILKLLMQNPSRVMTKSSLLERLADDTPDCTESSLKTHISHLRAKLREGSDKEYIEAVWGIGFKMKE